MRYMGSKSKQAKYIVPIIQRYIDNNDIEIYIEPFVGGGTTAIVAKKLHRHYIGFDISDKYINLTLQSLNNIK